MHQTSELYRTLLRDPRHRKETKVNIAGTDYGEDALLSLETSGGVFKEPDIGCCASRQIDLSLRKFGGIPRSAKIQGCAHLHSFPLSLPGHFSLQYTHPLG